MTNPRDLNDTQERGLLFMCVNANIERQFEFVQQTWVNNPSFNGLYNERDPIFGDTSAQKDGYDHSPGASSPAALESRRFRDSPRRRVLFPAEHQSTELPGFPNLEASGGS